MRTGQLVTGNNVFDFRCFRATIALNISCCHENFLALVFAVSFSLVLSYNAQLSLGAPHTEGDITIRYYVPVFLYT